jgi:hypothetical protein
VYKDLVPLPTASGTTAPTPGPADVDRPSTEFRPVQGGPELQSGEKLLVEAYAAIWIILFALILLSWRRQRRLDERMGALSAAIDEARKASADPHRREDGGA